MKCTCVSGPSCGTCEFCQNQLATRLKDMVECLKHRDDILFNGLEPDCKKCNDYGWIKCSCKECKNGS